MNPSVDELTELIKEHCNNDHDTDSLIRQRIYDTFKSGTYRVRYDTKEKIIGYADYDISQDGMLHVRKIIALKPGILQSLVRQIKDETNWVRSFWFRAKTGKWVHRRRVNNALV